MKKYNILKNAGVLLIVMVMVLSTVIVTAMNNRSVILYEGFEDGVMPPAGWTVFDYGEEGWWINSESFSGENAAYWIGTVASDLITYTIDTTSMTEAYLSFWHKQPSSSKGYETLSVYVDDGTWYMVADYTSEISSYTHEMIDLTAYLGGTLQVKFTATGGGGDGVYLDEVRICEGYTTEFMGLEVAPLGIADLEIIDTNLSVSNCGSGQPETNGVWINLEDSYNTWECTLENPFEPDVATTINFVYRGVVDGEPDQFISGMRLERESGGGNAVNVRGYDNAGNDISKIIAIGPNDDIVFYAEVDEVDDLGYIVEQSKGAQSIADLEIIDTNLTISSLTWHDAIGVLWTWEEHDVDELPIKQLMVIRELEEGIDEIILSDAQITSTGIDDFIVLEHYSYELDPPAEPTIDGSTSGKPGTAYTYAINNVGIEDAYFIIDWGDGTELETTELVAPGITESVSHTWTSQGTYIIKVRAMNEWGMVSDWAELSVTMPRNKVINRPILNFLEQHPILYQLLQRFLQI